MVSCYLCDNKVSATGSIAHSGSEYGTVKSIFIATDKDVEEILISKDLDFRYLGMKPRAQNTLANLKQQYKYFKIFKYFRLIQKFISFYGNLRQCEKILISENVEVVYVSSDRSYGGGFILPLIKAALKLDIKVVILDFADPADEERLYQYRRSSGRICSPDFVSKILFKDWILSSADGPEILMYPFSQLLVWWFFGVKSKNPKFIGHLNGVTLEIRNPQTFKRLRDSGVQRITLLNNYMMNEVDLASNKLEYDIALALPQLSEHKLCSNAIAQEIHVDLIQCLKSSGLNYVILLHPKMDRGYYRDFLKDYNVKIYDGSSHTAIGLSRGLLSVYSSLTHDAIACKKWAHVYDPLGFNYRMFECYPDLEISQNIGMLSRALKNFQRKHVLNNQNHNRVR